MLRAFPPSSALSCVALFGLVSACTAHLPSPKLVTVEVADGRFAYRTYGTPGTAAICDEEPRFLEDELSGVNSGLQRFLAATRGDETAAWPESRASRAEQWSQRLEEVLDHHARNLTQAGQCRFGRLLGYPPLIARGKRLIDEVRERQQMIDRVVATARAERALAEWRSVVRETQESARHGCPPRSATPIVYFAWRDEERVGHWRFCDSAELEQLPEGQQVLTPPEAAPARGQRRFRRAEYLEVARQFPSSAMMVPPAQVALE